MAKGPNVRRVIGYHGCDAVFAARVRSGRISLAQWKHSENPYDWLGKGIYFWEGGRTRAESWARKKFGDQADVLQVEIDLGHCLNLLESTYHGALRETYRILRTVYRQRNLPWPTNHNKGHYLDCLVIDAVVKLEDKQRSPFQTVRGVFEAGGTVFPVSAIRTQSHVQIAVRDYQCIRNPH